MWTNLTTVVKMWTILKFINFVSERNQSITGLEDFIWKVMPILDQANTKAIRHISTLLIKVHPDGTRDLLCSC